MSKRKFFFTFAVLIYSIFTLSFTGKALDFTEPVLHLNKTVINFSDNKLKDSVNFTLTNSQAQQLVIDYKILASDAELIGTHNSANKLSIEKTYSNNTGNFLDLTEIFTDKTSGSVELTTEKATKLDSYTGKTTITFNTTKEYLEGVYAKLYDTNSDGKGDTLVLNNYPNFISEGILVNDFGNKDNKDAKLWTPLIDITNVKIINEIKPNSTRSWFSSLTNLINIENLEKLNTSNVTDMYNMFYNCNNLEEIDVSHFDTSRVVNMQGMFGKTYKVKILDVSNWDTSNVANMAVMFQDAKSLTSLDVSHFNTSKVTSMDCMFQNITNITELDVSHFDTSNATSMGYMFYGDENLVSLDVSNFDTSKVTNMVAMFKFLSKITTLDVSHFDTSNVTNMYEMFRYMTNVKELKVDDFDTSKVTTMLGMFGNVANVESLNLSKWDTTNVTNMYGMFTMWDPRISNWTTTDTKLKSIIFSDKFNTSKVANMEDMFSGQRNLETLDLYSFDTSSLESAKHIFNQTDNLKTIYSKDWDISKLTDSVIFYDNSLVGGNGTAFSTSHEGKDYLKQDLHHQKGYFTSKNKWNITYDLNGGTISNSAWTHYFTEDNDYLLPTPIRDRYIFKGWTVGKNLYSDLSFKKMVFSYGIPVWETDTTAIATEYNSSHMKLSTTADFNTWVGEVSEKIVLEPNTTYTISTTQEGNAVSTRLAVYDIKNNEYVMNQYYTGQASNKQIYRTFTTDDTGIIALMFGIGPNNSGEYVDFTDIQIEEGDKMTPYEEHISEPTLIVPIKSGSEGHRTYVANWEEYPKYNISYDLDGGVNDNGTEINITSRSDDKYLYVNFEVGEAIDYNNIQIYKIGDLNKDVTVPIGTTGDIKYVANWDKIKYTINFSMDDLMEGKRLERGSIEDVDKQDIWSCNESDNSYTIYTKENWGGFRINSSEFAENGRYLLEYDAEWLDGDLVNIAGHSPSISNEILKINNVLIDSKYTSSAKNLPDNSKKYHVQLTYTYASTSSNNNIYIQPNRGFGETYHATVKISNVHLYEILDSTIEREYGDKMGELPTPTKSGYYFLGWYTEKDGGTKITADTTVTESATYYPHWGEITNFTYKNSVQTFTAPTTGIYQLEIWGASGGYAYDSSRSTGDGGYGGYSTGNVSLSQGEIIYIATGGEGQSNCQTSSCSGGWNGGSISTKWLAGDGSGLWTGGGGGATHIAKTTNRGTLNNYSNNRNEVLLVAGGGGGGDYFPWKSTYSDGTINASSTGGSGGGYKGVAGIRLYKTGFTNTPGTQDSGYAFGLAGTTRPEDSVGGSGGGWYGGISSDLHTPGSGGSGYINTNLLADTAMYCYGCEENTEVETRTISTTGTNAERNVSTCPAGYSSVAISRCAKSGNGYARITLIEEK